MSTITASCGLSRNRLKTTSCAYQMNKVVDLYLVTVNEVSAITTGVYTGSCGEQVTAVTLDSGAKWARIQPSNDSASFSDALVVGDNDMRYRTHTLSFSIGGDYDASAVCDVNALSLGEYIAVAVLASGNAILLGTKNVGLKATTVTNSGAATASEFSGIQVEMSADVTEAALPVNASALDGIKENIFA